MTILIVENNIEEQKRLVNFLKIRGITVKTATTGEDALKIIENEPLDLLVLDIDLDDDITGIDIAYRLKNTGINYIFNTDFPENFHATLPLQPISFIDKKDPNSIFRQLELFLMKETQKEGAHTNEITDEIPIKLFKGETIINRRHVIMAVSTGKERTRVYFKGVGGRPNYVKDVPYTLLFFVRLLKLKTFLKIQAKYAVNFTSDYIDSVYNDGTTKYLKLNEKDFVGIGGKRDTINNKLQIKQTYLSDINKVFKV